MSSHSQQFSTPNFKWQDNNSYRNDNVKEFTPSAPEFIPGIGSNSNNMQYYNGGGGGGGGGNDRSSSGGAIGMNSSANEYIPGGTGNIELSSSIENMVEVHWDGNTFFAPESMAYIGEDGTVIYMGSLEDVDIGNQLGLLWANNSTTLPAPSKRSLQTIGISEPLRNHFQSLDIESLRQMPPDDPRYKELPTRYHSAFPLGISSPNVTNSGNSFGYPSSLYKAIDQADSQLYVLRRLDNVRTAQSVIGNTINSWRSIQHPGIVPLYNIIFEKGALFFSYAYYPAAQSLKERFIDQRGPMLGEALIWRIFMQLFAALRLVHGRGLSIRVIDPAHIILTSGSCARFSCVGILDVVEFESRKTLAEFQQDDLLKLGRLLLCLTTRMMIFSPKNITDAMTLLKQHYSSDLQRITTALLSSKASLNQISIMLIDRIHDEYDTSLMGIDALHSHLQSEYENSRLLRLLIKLGFLNERPDQWSETADRYVLKLFRDYVFHQVDPDGLPVLDAGHILTALNKLDACDSEEILLNSRDGKDLLVVSFADIQRCLEKAFVDLSEQQSQSYIPPTILSDPSQPQQQSAALSMPHPQSYNFNGGNYAGAATVGGGGFHNHSGYQPQLPVSHQQPYGRNTNTSNLSTVAGNNGRSGSSTHNGSNNSNRRNQPQSQRSLSDPVAATMQNKQLLSSHQQSQYGGHSNNNSYQASSEQYFPGGTNIIIPPVLAGYDNSATGQLGQGYNNNYLVSGPTGADLYDGRNISHQSRSIPYNGNNSSDQGMNSHNKTSRQTASSSVATTYYPPPLPQSTSMNNNMMHPYTDTSNSNQMMYGYGGTGY